MWLIKIRCYFVSEMTGKFLLFICCQEKYLPGLGVSTHCWILLTPRTISPSLLLCLSTSLRPGLLTILICSFLSSCFQVCCLVFWSAFWRVTIWFKISKLPSSLCFCSYICFFICSLYGVWRMAKHIFLIFEAEWKSQVCSCR